ncbi:unnamed protein product, partial [Discosporangium mesarthrocarpum]
WRIRLGRAIRLEMERSLWLGEGPGQPGLLHLREIRKALVALARELNASEADRLSLELELEGQGRAAAAGVEERVQQERARVAQLEEAIRTLQDRMLELEEGGKAAAAAAAGEVSRLESAKQEADSATERLQGEVAVLQGCVKGLEEELCRARELGREGEAIRDRLRKEARRMGEALEKEERSTLLLKEEVEQLKSFAQRADRERDEVLMREKEAKRDSARERNPTQPPTVIIPFTQVGLFCPNL